MPLGATVSSANANEGQQAANTLRSLVILPPKSVKSQTLDQRDLPTVLGDGAYGNNPTRKASVAVGFRIHAPSRGQTKITGSSRIRIAVEHGHAFLSQFGRISRRLDRCVLRYLAWIQLAACIIFIRAGFICNLN